MSAITSNEQSHLTEPGSLNQEAIGAKQSDQRTVSVTRFDGTCDDGADDADEEELMDMDVERTPSMQVEEEQQSLHKEGEEEGGVIAARREDVVPVPGLDGRESGKPEPRVHQHVLQVVPVDKLAVLERGHQFPDESNDREEDAEVGIGRRLRQERRVVVERV